MNHVAPPPKPISPISTEKKKSSQFEQIDCIQEEDS